MDSPQMVGVILVPTTLLIKDITLMVVRVSKPYSPPTSIEAP